MPRFFIPLTHSRGLKFLIVNLWRCQNIRSRAGVCALSSRGTFLVLYSDNNLYSLLLKTWTWIIVITNSVITDILPQSLLKKLQNEFEIATLHFNFKLHHDKHLSLSWTRVVIMKQDFKNPQRTWKSMKEENAEGFDLVHKQNKKIDILYRIELLFDWEGMFFGP